MNNDCSVVIKAKRKLNDEWNNLLHYWNDDFKRTYEKEVIDEMNNSIDMIYSSFNEIVEQEEELDAQLRIIEKRIEQSISNVSYYGGII